jgi:hypothetical protein
MSSVGGRIAAWLVVLALLAVAFVAGILAFTIDGLGPPSSQCARAQQLPTVGGPYYENTTITGSPVWLPLGIACTYDSPDDAVGPQTVLHLRWGETVVVVAALGLAVVAGGFAVGALPRVRHILTP